MRKYLRYAVIGLSIAALGMTAGCSKTEKAETTAAPAVETTAAEKPENYVAETEVKLGKYKGLSYEMAKIDVDDEMLDKEIATVMEQLGQSYQKVDRAAKDGDQVIIDYVGTIDGVAFDGGTANGQPLVLGSGRYIAGFEDGLVGAKAGEKRDLNLKFPEDYGAADLAGKDCVFAVTVNEVQEPVSFTEVDDAFVNAFLAAVPTKEEVNKDNFREFFRKYLTDIYEENANNLRDSDLINMIVEDSDIICSTELIDKEYELRKQVYASQGAMYGLDYDTIIALSGISDDQVREEAEEMAKQLAVLGKIAEEENIKVTNDDILELVKSIGYNSKEMLLATGVVTEEELEQTTLMRKTLDFVVENADITVK